MRHWFYLAAAIAAEVTGTSLLKWGADSGNLLGLAANFCLLAFSFYLLALVVEHIPVGVAYAVWEGIGIVIISLVGFAIFGETLSTIKSIAIIAIITGIILLKRGTAMSESATA
ncbi:MAG: multidrug efflux SMR transporter [Burkholderiaceae bacterium]